MILSCRPEDGRGCQNAVPYCGAPPPHTTTFARPRTPYDLSSRKSPAFSRRRQCHRSRKHTREEMRSRARRLLANLIYRHRSGLLHGIYPCRNVVPLSYIAFLEPLPSTDFLYVCIHTVCNSYTKLRCGENNFVISFVIFLPLLKTTAVLYLRNILSCLIYPYLGRPDSSHFSITRTKYSKPSKVSWYSVSSKLITKCFTSSEHLINTYKHLMEYYN